MTGWTRNNCHEPRRQQAPIAGGKALASRDRRYGIVVSSGVLGVAGAVLAVMMLTATPTSAAPGAPPPTMSADMPGMDHGSAAPTSTPSPAMAGDMPGMDHGDGHGSTPSPTMSGDMPGMDHGHAVAPEASPAPGHGSGDMPGMEHGSGGMPAGAGEHGKSAGAVRDRPLVPVLGTFGGGASAVLLSAAFLRRRDRAADLVKEAARAARRAQR